MQKHGTVAGSFGYDGISLASCGSEVGYGFFVGVLLVKIELGAGWWLEFVNETFQLQSIVDVGPYARDGFQPILNFDLGGFQCR